MSESYARHAFLIVFIVTWCFSCADRDRGMDNSLTIDAYKELGMPDANKKWTMADYTQAYNVLAKLRWEKQLQLPVRNSDKSGLLFDRMVSLDYLSFLQDSALTRSEKAQRISEFGVAYDYWIDLYTTPTVQANYYNREIVDIQIFNLGLTEAAFNLANEINESDDPADIALQYGYNTIKRGYLECLNDYLLPRNDRSEFAHEDMGKMVDSIYHSVMRNKEWLDSSDVSVLKQSVRSVMDSTSSARLVDKYKLLEKQLPS